MRCTGCADPTGHSPRLDCRACQIRELARGPLFFECVRHNRLTDAYKAALRRLGPVADVHLEVRDAAKQYATGAHP